MTDSFDTLDELAEELYKHVVSHGFQGKSLHTDLLLIISELIEMFEDERNGLIESDKLPGFSIYEEESADAIIRILTNCAERGWRIGAAVRAKHQFNLGRPHKHGKKF